MKSKFIISLDFELKWGVFDVLGDEYNKNILGARLAIPKILDIFEKNNIKATWAIVGFLFASNKDEYKKFKPLLTPSYDKKYLDPYKIEIGETENQDKLSYAGSLVNLIKNTKNQEIASHTYCHYYCTENGQTKLEFENDVSSMVSISSDKGLKPIKSIVFPLDGSTPSFDASFENLLVVKNIPLSKCPKAPLNSLTCFGVILLDPYLLH